MHSMQAGYLEKAQKYTDKALMQLEKLKSKCHLGGDPTQSHVHAQGGQGSTVYCDLVWSLFRTTDQGKSSQ